MANVRTRRGWCAVAPTAELGPARLSRRQVPREGFRTVDRTTQREDSHWMHVRACGRASSRSVAMDCRQFSHTP